MKSEHKDLSPTELALLTWYQPDNPKYRDPLHPTLKLAGEVGELLDLYAKHLFKPDFDWMDCKWCNSVSLVHHNPDHECWQYEPKVIDELGDIWYYLRILAWINDVNLIDNRINNWSNELDNIETMYDCANIFMKSQGRNKSELPWCFHNFSNLLVKLDCTLDQLTELNYLKLNSEETNHGWKEAK